MEKQSFKNGDILTVMIAQYYSHMTVIQRNKFYNTGLRVATVKCISFFKFKNSPHEDIYSSFSVVFVVFLLELINKIIEG